jgi:hypothetical protein
MCLEQRAGWGRLGPRTRRQTVDPEVRWRVAQVAVAQRQLAQLRALDVRVSMRALSDFYLVQGEAHQLNQPRARARQRGLAGAWAHAQGVC